MITSDIDIIHLNIGGTHKITTTRNTLCKIENTGLFSIFKNKEKINLPKQNEFYFIDRDGKIFMLLLSYLRNMKIPFFESKYDEVLFYEELEYWGFSFNNNSKFNNNIFR